MHYDSRFPAFRHADECRPRLLLTMVRHLTRAARTGMLVPCGVAFLLALAPPSDSHAGEPPCDKYPEAKQEQCRTIWKQLNDQAIADIAQFGLAQQRKREAGQLTPEQHLAENIAYIKQSTDLRLKRLDERMMGK